MSKSHIKENSKKLDANFMLFGGQKLALEKGYVYLMEET